MTVESAPTSSWYVELTSGHAFGITSVPPTYSHRHVVDQGSVEICAWGIIVHTTSPGLGVSADTRTEALYPWTSIKSCIHTFHH